MTKHPIAIFIPSVHGGGAERAMLIFAEELAKRSINVEVVVGSLEGAWRNMLPDSLSIVDLGATRMVKTVLPLRRYIVSRRPVALFSTISHANLGALIAKVISGVDMPVIVRQSNTPLSEYKESSGAKWVGRLIPYVYSWADAIIAVSDSVRDDLVTMKPHLASLIKVIPTPVLFSAIFDQAREVPDHPWFRDKKIPIIVSVGRLKPHKGMYDLVKAFSYVIKKKPARLVIVGEGDDRKRIEKFVATRGLAENVALVGFKSNPFSFMRHSDVFVLASHYEGLPNVLIQALALGVPVVATDSPGGVRELLKDGLLGHLVPVGQIKVMADAIITAFSRERNTAGSPEMLARYHVEDATDQYLSLLNSVMSSRAQAQ